MTLRLRVPALSDVAHDSVETRRTFVAAWIESLPYADPARLMEALYTALAELNRSPNTELGWKFWSVTSPPTSTSSI